MRQFIAFTLVAAGLAALCAPAAADEKQEIILKAIRDYADSIVKIEYECKQTDGKGARKFSTTGVVVSAEGLVMVTGVTQIDPPVGGRYQKPKKFKVIFQKEMKAEAKFLGKDEELNLGLLEIVDKEPEEGEKKPVIKPLSMVETEGLAQAQEILILNRLSKNADYKPTFTLMRVMAVVEKPAGPPQYLVTGGLHGVTGCPVLTMDGRVVGFVGRTSVEPSSGGRSYTIGGRTYYFPRRGRTGSPRILCYRDFKEFLSDPSKFLRRKCWIGIRGFQALNKDLAETLGAKEKGGVILGEILKRSPASRAGLRERDIVVKINGERLDIAEDKDVEKFTKRVQRAKAGEKLTLILLRDGDKGLEEKTLVVVMEEEPTREFEVEEWEDKTFGLRVKPLTRDFLDRGRLDLDTKGVRVTNVESAGWAYLAGVRRGDIIHGVVLVKTPDLEAFKRRMAEITEAREPEVCFSVLRAGKSLFRCVRPQWDLKKGAEKEDKKK